MITVIFVKNPFEPQKNREIHQLPYVAGAPVSHYVQKCTDMLSLSDMVISRNSYTINGDQSVHDRDFIVFSPVVGKGHGKNPLLIIATVALSVVSMGVGGLVASGTWGGAALASATGFAAIGGYLAAAAVMFIGGTLIQRAFGTANTRGYQDNSENPTYSWSGIQTTSGQNNPIPITYGTVRSGGQTIGKYITSDADKQYLNWLVAAGYGPLKIYDVQLNDNPIENYKNVRLDTRSGLNDQDIIPNFNDTVSTKSLGYELLESEWRTDLVTGNATQGLIIYVECSNGLYYANDKGGLDETFVEIAAQYAPEGSSDWKDFLRPHHYWESRCKYVSLNDDTAPIGEYDIKFESHDNGTSYKISIGGYSTTYTAKPERTIAVGPFNWVTTHEFVNWIARSYGKVYVRATRDSTNDGMIKGNKSSAIRRQYRVDHLPEGQYQVRVKVVSRGYPVTSTRASTRVWWTAVSGIVYDDFTYPGIALIGVRALATDQLSGSPTMKFMKQRSTVYIWNPGTQTYEEQAATNPAWAAYDMIHRAEKITDVRSGGTTYIHSGADASLLLYNQFAEWAAYCDRFKLKINIEINTSGELLDVVNRFIAPVGRGMVELFGTKYGCCWDGPKEAVQMFGMGNIISGTFSETFLQTSDRANAVELTFTNAQKDYQRDTVKVFGPTFDSDEYDTTSQLTYDGITDYEQAYREAKFQLYCNAYMVRTVSFQAAIDAIACTVGDVIYVAHDVPMWQNSGRIASVDGNTVVVNTVMKSYDSAKTYTFAYRSTADDTRYEVGCQSITVNDATTTVVLSETPASPPAAGDIFDIAEVNKGTKKFVVRSISRTEDMVREIEAIEYNENVFNENYDIPTPNYSTAQPNQAENVINVSAKQIHWLASDGTKHAHLYATWQLPDGAYSSKFIVYASTDNVKWNQMMETGDMACDFDTDPDTIYYLKIKTITNVSQSSGVTVTVDVGEDAPPNDVTGLTATKITSNTTQVKLSWAANTDIDLKGYRVYVNGVLHSNILTDTTYTYTADQSGQYMFAVVAVDNSDNESANQATVTDVITCEPADVTGFTVQQSDADRSIAVFNWAANKEVDLSYYEIRVGDTWDTGTVLVTETKATTARYTLPSSGSYTFWIKASNAEGFYSANAAQLVEQVTLEPDAVTGLVMAQSTQDKSKATLSWSAPAGGDIADYAVKYGTSWDAGTLVAKTKEIKLTVALPGNGTWHYMVQAVTVAGYTSTIASTDITASIQPLDVTNFRATQDISDKTKVRLQWDAAAEPDVMYYKIRQGSNWDTAESVAERVNMTFFDVIVDDEAQHTWLIKAVTIAGNESQYAASVSGIYDLRPNPVASIQASQNSNNRSILNINWAEVTDGDLSGYQVKIGDNWDAGEPLPFTRELYATYTITSSGTFKVMIKAMNAAGYYSDEVSIACTVQVEPSNVTRLVAYQNGDTVELYWDKSPDNDVSGYEIREGYSFDSGALVSTGVANTDYTMAIDTARFYHYFVKAINSNGKYSKTAASVSLTVSNLSPRNVIQTFDEIALASGTHDNTEFGTSLINFQTIGGKWSDYPTTKFSEVGGSSVLKLAKEVTGTFTRNSVAYKEDGTQVAAGVPRFGANGLLIEEGTTNYYGGQTPGSVRHGSATVSINEITTNVPAAGRYWQITGDSVDGTTANNWWSGMEQSMPALGTSFKAGDVITCSAWLKVATTALGKSVSVQVYKSDWTGALATGIAVPLIRDGKWHRYSATLIFNADYTGNPIFDIFSYGYVTDQNFTYYVGGYQVEKKSYATSTVPASFGRTVEALTVPGSVFSAEEGTLEFTINPLVVASWNNYFNFSGTWGRFLIFLSSSGQVTFDYGSTNSGLYIASGVPVNALTKISVSWSASAGKRSLVVNGQSTQVDWPALDGFSAPSAINVVNNYSAWIKNIRFSNTAHSVEKMVADAALSVLPVEDDTTCLLRLADTLDMYYGAGIYTSAVIDIASIITCNVTTLFTSSVDLKGGSAALQVRTSQDGTTWLDWEGFKPIQRTFRYIQFRILLETTDITKTPEVNQCIVSIDVPDTDIALTATISTGGTTVSYGHTYYTVPAVVPAAIGENLHAELISKTLNDCVIKIKNASNTDVGGTADIRIKGY